MCILSIIQRHRDDLPNIFLFKYLIIIMILLYTILLSAAGLYAHFYSLHNYIYLSVIYLSVFHIFLCYWRKEVSLKKILFEGDFIYLIAYIYWLYYFSKQELVYIIPLLLGSSGRIMEIIHENDEYKMQIVE